MSRRGRTEDRAPSDAYPTPPWVLRRYLDQHKLRPGPWLEPAVGTGVLVQEAQDHPNRNPGTVWYGSDLNHNDAAAKLLGPRYDGACDVRVHEGSVHTVGWPTHYAGILTNPPFLLAEEFLRVGLLIADEVVLLLPLKWLESRKRASLLDRNFPDVSIVPDRPSFMPSGQTDVTAYAWMRWRSHEPQTSGRIERLALTSPEERGKKSRAVQS